ncbi:unnamed protein product, partial [Symbiodinium necroappetens]
MSRLGKGRRDRCASSDSSAGHSRQPCHHVQAQSSSASAGNPKARDAKPRKVEAYVAALTREMEPLLSRQETEALARFLYNFVQLKSQKKLLPLQPMLGMAYRTLLPALPADALASTGLAMVYSGLREGSAWQ